MGFPLIQQPSPLQQLATLLQGLRQQGMETRMQNEEMSRRREYLALQQQEAVDNRAYRTQQQADRDRDFSYGQTRDMREDKRRSGLDALALEDRQRGIAADARQGVRAGLAPDTRISDALADRAVEDPLELQQITGYARQAARPGLQGSASRAPRVGEYKGAVVTPPTLSYNAPSGGGSSGGRPPNGVQERHAIGQSLLRRVIDEATVLETRNPSAGQVPFAQDAGAALAERVLGTHAGGRIANRVRSFGSDADQRRYHQLREQFKHSMAVFYPRAAIVIFENLADSYFGVGGETDEDLAAKRADREFVGQVIDDVRSGRVPRTELDRVLGARGAPDLSQFADPALPDDAARNSAGQSVGVPSAGGASPQSQSALDRYLSRLPR